MHHKKNLEIMRKNKLVNPDDSIINAFTVTHSPGEKDQTKQPIKKLRDLSPTQEDIEKSKKFINTLKKEKLKFIEKMEKINEEMQDK